MAAIENASRRQIGGYLKKLDTIQRKDLRYTNVSGNQIISALLKETGLTAGATGFVYQVLQGVANEARRRGLLVNPNPYSRETYSTAVGNTERMMPSLLGWEQTKGILMAHVEDAKRYLRKFGFQEPGVKDKR